MLFQTRSSRPSDRAGFTLLESAVVLGVIALLVGGIWMIVKVVYENTYEHQARMQIATLVRNFRQLYSRVGELTPDIPGDYTTLLDQQNAVPAEMRINAGANDGKLNHPWTSDPSGNVRVLYSTPSVFSVYLSRLPRKPCVALVSKLSGGEISGLSSILVDGTTYSSTDFPVGVVTANVGCNSDTNGVYFNYNLRG
ncbi:MAG TPA: type II secretion system protein [Alphaproteobacteria bacterium]|nr:type II secretion system protein [Alphaproteobacteria bacterium]